MNDNHAKCENRSISKQGTFPYRFEISLSYTLFHSRNVFCMEEFKAVAKGDFKPQLRGFFR